MSTSPEIINHVESGVTTVYSHHNYDKEKLAALEAWSKQPIVMVSDLQIVEESEAQ